MQAEIKGGAKNSLFVTFCCHVYVILFVLYLLVIQCGCHMSQLKSTFLLTYLLTYLLTFFLTYLLSEVTNCHDEYIRGLSSHPIGGLPYGGILPWESTPLLKNFTPPITVNSPHQGWCTIRYVRCLKDWELLHNCLSADLVTVYYRITGLGYLKFILDTIWWIILIMMKVTEKWDLSIIRCRASCQ